jgi:dihydropteroate synthase
MQNSEATYLLQLASRTLDLRARPCIMGILNATPDSFSDGGRLPSHHAAIEYALQMAEDGADIIDVGGESTRPGAVDVSTNEELHRVIPIIEGLRSASQVAISIDTRKAAVAEAALAAGADIVNDISALRFDQGMAAVVADRHAPLVIMHMTGTPATMQENPAYDNVVGDVLDFLRERLAHSAVQGISQVIVDPGIGFGKTLEHNLALLAALPRVRVLGAPVLVGISRKSMIGQLTGRAVDQRLAGSVAAAVLALRSGASIFRVHDVRETRDALDVATAILRMEEQHAV